MKPEFSLVIVEEKLKITFHENPSNGNTVTPRGLSDMTKLSLFAKLLKRLETEDEGAPISCRIAYTVLVRPMRRAEKLATVMCRLKILEASTPPNPRVLSRPIQGYLYLYLNVFINFIWKITR